MFPENVFPFTHEAQLPMFTTPMMLLGLIVMVLALTALFVATFWAPQFGKLPVRLVAMILIAIGANLPGPDGASARVTGGIAKLLPRWHGSS